MTSKLIVAALTCVLMLLSDGAAAEQKKLYPPYPDVWGLELPVPGGRNQYVQIGIDQQADGDMIIYELYPIPNAKPFRVEAKSASFFSGVFLPVSTKKADKVQELYEPPFIHAPPELLRFSNGDYISSVWIPTMGIHFYNKTHRTHDWDNCVMMDSSMISHKDPRLPNENKTVFVQIFDEYETLDMSVFCETPDGEARTYRSRIEILDLNVRKWYVLEDQTFLAVLGDRFIVRLNRQLRSPFFDTRPDLIALDYKTQVEPIFNEATRLAEADPDHFPALQYAMDKLTELVLSLKKQPIPTH